MWSVCGVYEACARRVESVWSVCEACRKCEVCVRCVESVWSVCEACKKCGERV